MFDTRVQNVTLPVVRDRVALATLIAIEVIGIVGNLIFLTAITFRRSFRNKKSRTYIYLSYVSVSNIGLNFFVMLSLLFDFHIFF